MSVPVAVGVMTAAAIFVVAERLRPPPERVVPRPAARRRRSWSSGLRRRRDVRRRAAAVAADLAGVVDLLALAVGAGLTVPQAVAAVAGRASGPLAAELAVVVAKAARGRRWAEALDDLPGRAGEATRPLAAALAACDRYGAPVAEALDRLAVEAREQQRRRTELAARRVPVLLLFPLVLCILPAFALLAVAPLLADAVAALRP